MAVDDVAFGGWCRFLLWRIDSRYLLIWSCLVFLFAMAWFTFSRHLLYLLSFILITSFNDMVQVASFHSFASLSRALISLSFSVSPSFFIWFLVSQILLCILWMTDAMSHASDMALFSLILWRLRRGG